jgi:hypothetical protein
MAMFGWTDAKMVRTDTRKAAQNKLAASGAAKSLSYFLSPRQKKMRWVRFPPGVRREKT